MPASNLRMMFYETLEKTSSERGKDTRTATYNGGFRIEIRNTATKVIGDVEVDYVMIYRKDADELRTPMPDTILTPAPDPNQPPVANAGPLTSGCAGEAMTCGTVTSAYEDSA